jgi:hypothetical protein
MTRNTIIAALIVIVTGAGIWIVLGGSGAHKTIAGMGDFDAEFYACKEKVFEDLMHPLELVFLDNTEWHAGDAAEFSVGGKLQFPNVEGGLDIFAYQCLSRDGKIQNMEIR